METAVSAYLIVNVFRLIRSKLTKREFIQFLMWNSFDILISDRDRKIVRVKRFNQLLNSSLDRWLSIRLLNSRIVSAVILLH